MIIIHQGYVEDSTLFTDIEIDGQVKRVFIAVEDEYKKFLSPERSDYALIGMLAYAMRNRHDIICETPVTEELLYKIREILIPTLVKSDSRNYAPKIQANMAPPLEKARTYAIFDGGGAVGTGLSCGVDSFHAVAKYLNSEYPSQNLTHITVYNIGSINSCYGNENIPRVKQKVFERAEKVTAEIGLPLVKLESNFQDVIPQVHYTSHTYMDGLAIYSLQKLWRIYYYASAYFFGNFSLKNNFDSDPAHFELFLLDCLSTSNLKIISEAGEGTRNDKIKFIADNPIVQKNLHVCIAKEYNCGVCPKCLRTLLALDALNKLDKFHDVFDVENYTKNIVNNYLFLFQKYVLEHDEFFEETFKILYNRHKKFFDLIVVEKN